MTSPENGNLEKLRLTVGSNIKKAREKRGYTQRGLAKLLSFSTMTLSKIERGMSTADSAKIKEISKILRIPFNAFFVEETSKQDMIEMIEGLINEGEYVKAENLAEDLIAISTDGNEKPYSLNLLAKVLIENGKYSKAILALKEIESFGVQDRQLLLMVNYNFALSSYYLKDYSEALNRTWNVLDFCELEDDKITCLHLQANIYSERRSYNEAIERFDKVLGIYRTSNNNKMLIRTLQSIGDIHYKSGDLVAAEDFYRDALNMARQINSAEDIARVSISLVKEILLPTGKTEESLLVLDNALSQKGVGPHLRVKLVYYKSLCLDDGPMKIRLLENVVEDSEIIDDKELVCGMCFSLARLYERQGDKEKAMQYYRRGSDIFLCKGE